MLGQYADLPRQRTLADSRVVEALRFLIPALWPEETFPMLSGNPKAGKTTVGVDLVAALAVPGRRFLGHFEPAQMTDEQRERGFLLINAETEAKTLEAALRAELDVDVQLSGGMTVKASETVTVEHLKDLGGAQMFDLTDPEIYKMWPIA